MPEQFEGEPSQNLNEVEFKNGDTLKITALTEILYKKDPTEGVEETTIQPSLEEALELQKALGQLPFRIGLEEHIGTMSRPTHEIAVAFRERVLEYNAETTEREKLSLRLEFSAKTSEHPLRLQTHKNLSVNSSTDDQGGSKNFIRFTPEEPLTIAGRKIGEVVLVMPTHSPEKKS